MTLAKFAIPAVLTAALFAAPAFGDPADDLKEAIKKLEKATKDLGTPRTHSRSRTSQQGDHDRHEDRSNRQGHPGDQEGHPRDQAPPEGTANSARLRSPNRSTRGQGRVRFINEFSEEMSVVVNGRSYRLLPGQERLVAVPPGDFTYQVLQLQRVPQERRIEANETKTIRIYPLP